ncbi:MAG: DUF4179 domain-containing protein [Acutalibacter sp.]
MKNKREQEAIRAYFAQEPVPVEIHNALRQACQQLPPREESPAPAAGKAWRRLGGALSTAAAAFVLLCCLNAVNPAFAESVPLLGEAFRLYNSQNKVAVGSYVGTYPQMEQPDAAAAAADAQGMELTLHESYSDGCTSTCPLRWKISRNACGRICITSAGRWRPRWTAKSWSPPMWPSIPRGNP